MRQVRWAGYLAEIWIATPRPNIQCIQCMLRSNCGSCFIANFIRRQML